MGLLIHINRRVKSRPKVQLPVEALLLQYQDPAASSFVIVRIREPNFQIGSSAQIITLENVTTALEKTKLCFNEILIHLQNFTIIYIKLGYPRMEMKKQAELVPSILNAMDGKPVSHQDRYIIFSFMYQSDAAKDEHLILSNNTKIINFQLATCHYASTGTNSNSYGC